MSSGGSQEQVTITGLEILHRTENAILAELDGEEAWIPLSLVTRVVTSVHANSSSVTFAAWKAKQLGWI